MCRDAHACKWLSRCGSLQQGFRGAAQVPQRFEFCGMDAKHGHSLAAGHDSAAAPEAAAEPPASSSPPISELYGQPPAPSSPVVSEDAAGSEQEGGAGQSERRALLAVEREAIYSKCARPSAALVHSCALILEMHRLGGRMSFKVHATKVDLHFTWITYQCAGAC